MPYSKVTGIVTRYVDYKENDRILSIFTLERGRIDANARGCRRPKSPLLPAAQPFVYGEFELFVSKDRAAVNQVNIQEPFFPLREVGRYASESGIDLVLCVGKEAEYMYASASSLTPDRCLYFSECSSLIDTLPSLIRPGDTVLVKASRGMHLEQIVQFFMDGYVQK